MANDSALIFVDMQVGLLNGIEDKMLEEFFTNVRGLANVGALFGTPVIITSLMEESVFGPTIPLLNQILPNAHYYNRASAINPWDDSGFLTLVNSLNVKNLIIAGLSIDAVLYPMCWEAINAGFNTFIVMDVSGTYTKISREIASFSLSDIGCKQITWLTVGNRFMMNWSGNFAKIYASVLGQSLPFFGDLMSYYATVVPNSNSIFYQNVTTQGI